MNHILVALALTCCAAFGQVNGTMMNDRTTKHVAAPADFWDKQPSDPKFVSAVRASQTNSGGSGISAATATNIAAYQAKIATNGIDSAAYHPSTDFYLSSNPNGYVTASVTNPLYSLFLPLTGGNLSGVLSFSEGLSNAITFTDGSGTVSIFGDSAGGMYFNGSVNGMRLLNSGELQAHKITSDNFFVGGLYGIGTDPGGLSIDTGFPFIFGTDGTLSATFFAGNGGNINSLSADNINAGTLSFAYGGTGANLVDPGVDSLMGYDATDNGVAFFLLGGNLTYDHATHTLNSTGGASPGDAVANGTTKGIATFTAADFNSSSGVISLDYANAQKATASLHGLLSSNDWTTFNSKQSALTTGNLSATSPLSADNTRQVIGGSLTLSIQNAAADGSTKGAASFAAADFNASSGNISIDYANAQQATAGQNGILFSNDWSTFNNKQSALTTGNLTASSPISLDNTRQVIGGAAAISIQNAAADGSTKGAASFSASDFNASSGNISIDYANAQQATAGQNGILFSNDWSTFNGKQAAGNYITTLTGVISASGPGSASASFGTFTSATLFTALSDESGNAGVFPRFSLTGLTAGHTIGWDGSTWTNGPAATGSASAAGSDTQVQFNDGGTALGGDAGLTYAKTTDTLTIAGALNVPKIVGNGAGGSGSEIKIWGGGQLRFEATASTDTVVYGGDNNAILTGTPVGVTYLYGGGQNFLNANSTDVYMNLLPLHTVGIDATTMTNAALTASALVAADANKKMVGIANGSTSTVLVGGTPPSFGSVPAGAMPALTGPVTTSAGAVATTMKVAIGIACSDETTALTTGTAKATFRMPFAMTVTEVRATLTTAQTAGSIFTVDINESGTTIISTKLTIDNNEKTSTTAATPPVISDSSLADDAEMTVDIDQIGTSGATGLKIWIIGTRS